MIGLGNPDAFVRDIELGKDGDLLFHIVHDMVGGIGAGPDHIDIAGGFFGNLADPLGDLDRGLFLLIQDAGNLDRAARDIADQFADAINCLNRVLH